MAAQWPGKQVRQREELAVFLRAYRYVGRGRSLELVRWRDRPDVELRDSSSGQLVGLELTAVFESDRSVPELHLASSEEFRFPPPDPSRIAGYLDRLVLAVQQKVEIAREGYDLYPEMILSCFVADYIAIYISSPGEWQAFAKRVELEVGDLSPFTEVVLPNLPNHGILSLP